MPDDAKDSLPEVELFTDGACDPNPGPGGYGVVLKFGRHRRELSGGFKDTTNNRMELMAAIIGLRALTRRCRVRLVSDSEYLVESVSKGWAMRWRERGWWRSANQRAANHDLWAELLDLLAGHEVAVIWTKGHNGDPDNERCDELACQGIQSSVIVVDEGYEQAKLGGPQSIPEGHPCFKCATPLVKRSPKKKKAGGVYRYEWYLYCPGCSSIYMVDEGKRVGTNPATPSLFNEGDG